MTIILVLAGRAGSLAQQAMLMAAPHGLQSQARRNALRSVIADDARRDHWRTAAAALSAAEARRNSGAQFVSASCG